MNTKIAVISSCLLLLTKMTVSAQVSQPAVLSASGGRYVFGQISSMRADQYMLDTQTGRLWQLVVDTNNASLLVEVPYKSLSGGFTLQPKTQQLEYREMQNAVGFETNQLNGTNGQNEIQSGNK